MLYDKNIIYLYVLVFMYLYFVETYTIYTGNYILFKQIDDCCYKVQLQKRVLYDDMIYTDFDHCRMHVESGEVLTEV